MSSTENWGAEFREVWDRGVARWRAGRDEPGTMFEPEEAAFLESIGCSTQELFDFVDDHLRYGEPSYATAFEVTGIRRDYFLKVLGGKRSGRTASMESLPAKTAAVDGMAWLPRLIVKAKLKLRGEMPADLMFGCGGDRAFLASVKMSPPEFLRRAWEAGEDDRAVIEAVKRSASKPR